jgi:hypothetical protein
MMNKPKLAAVIGLFLNVPVWAMTGQVGFACVWFAGAIVVALLVPAR